MHGEYGNEQYERHWHTGEGNKRPDKYGKSAEQFNENRRPRQQRGSGHSESMHELEPIFALLEQRYDIPLLEAEYSLEAISADQDVAAALGVEAGSPIFRIERTSYSVGDRPVDYEKLHYRGDLIRFRTRLARRKSAGV